VIGTCEPPKFGHDGQMFFFFSNRLGCFGSLMVSVIGSLVLIGLLMLAFRR
jgi:hypothetical protein